MFPKLVNNVLISLAKTVKYSIENLQTLCFLLNILLFSLISVD